MNKLILYKQTIERAVPDIRISNAELNTDGQNNDVLFVNDEWVFRFPKYPTGIIELSQETAILRAIQDQTTLPIPTPIFEQLVDQQVGQAFVGYRLLPGAPLWREQFQQITEVEVIERLAKQLASFLRGLHAIPPSIIDHKLIPTDTHAEWANLYQRFRAKLYSRMEPYTQEWTTTTFESFLTGADNFKHTYVLTHGDFGTSNIIFNEETQQISGIIDFGHAGVGDPAADFAGLYVSYGDTFLRQCAVYYPAINDVWERILFYSNGPFILLDALFCLENGEVDDCDEVMVEYNEFVRAKPR